ncbi:hypothetical protein, partial [Microcoleus sp. ARI1-A3]|uniref:hypothetical protein n=1 Tax=Microcoleus sp. ARI1-A3 TaxID=2818558 RepID=UPI002FD68311
TVYASGFRELLMRLFMSAPDVAVAIHIFRRQTQLQVLRSRKPIEGLLLSSRISPISKWDYSSRESERDI